MGAFVNLAGRQFGLWTVLGPWERRSTGKIYWLCQCKCGTQRWVAAGNLPGGGTISCGCVGAKALGDRKRTHGATKTPLHRRWLAMIERCTNPNHEHYGCYGGRGIKVCRRWRESFQAFADDMGNLPSLKHELDRIDNEGNYEPGNVRWSTRKQNTRNKRSTHFLEHFGERLSIADWSERTGLSQRLIWKRMDRGWSVHDALTTPKRHAR